MIKKKSRIIAIVAIASAVLTSCFVGVNSGQAEAKKFERHDIVVVGAGISGLTCGYYLNEEDEDFIILEKKDKVGGRTIAGSHESFTYAKGTEYLGEPESPLVDMIDDLGLVPKEIPSPMDAYFDGNNFYYGYEGIKRYLVTNSSNDDYREFAELVLDEYEDYDEIPDLEYNDKEEALDNITARQWFKDNEVPEVFINKYNVASKGLFGASLDDISALSFVPEIAFDFEGGINDEDVDYSDFDEEDLQDEYEEAREENSDSYSFVKGISELTDKLGEVLEDNIRLNSNVKSIIKKGSDYLVKYIDKNGKECIVITEKVVLAVPAPEALKIAPTVISREKKEIIDTIKFSSYATVALFSETPIFDKAFDLAVPDDYFFTDIYDSTWVERYYDEDKKDQEDYIISVYVAPKTSDDHSLDMMSDEELIKNVYKDLDKIFDSASSKVTGYDIERFPYAYPVMSLGAYERLMELNDLNEGSIILAGDYMVYPTFEAAVQAGYMAAEKICQ